MARDRRAQRAGPADGGGPGQTIAAFEALRGTLRFEDEPASFEAALQATGGRRA